MVISRVRQRRVAERIQVTDQEVQNFLASDLGKMQLSEEFHLANILIPVADGSPETIQAADRQAKDLYQQLQQGADFAQLAISRSAGETALEGGEIGWRKAAQLPPLRWHGQRPSPGEVTEPVRTPGGFIILKLLESAAAAPRCVTRCMCATSCSSPARSAAKPTPNALAERLYQRIQSGEDFAELAKNFSEDPGSALNGGDLNWIDPNALVPEFREVMAKTPAGQLSRPFKSPYGWHVLEVLGRRATDSADQMREQQAINVLRNRKYDEELPGCARSATRRTSKPSSDSSAPCTQWRAGGNRRHAPQPESPAIPRFALTPGEPAGIGPDLCLLLSRERQPYR